QIGGAIDELRVTPDPGVALQIEADLHMDAPLSEVTVEGSVVVELVEEPPQIAKIRPESLPRDRCLVPPFPARRCTRHVRRRAWSRLADPPDRCRLRVSVDARPRL